MCLAPLKTREKPPIYNKTCIDWENSWKNEVIPDSTGFKNVYRAQEKMAKLPKTPCIVL